MKTMTSKEIKDRYGVFAETARREPVIHTSHGRPVLVTISWDRAREIPALREELERIPATEKGALVAQLRALAGSGKGLAGLDSDSEFEKRSRAFRGDE